MGPNSRAVRILDRLCHKFLTSVRHTKRGAVLRARAAPVVEPGGGHVGVAEPLLDLAQVGPAVQGIGGRGGPQGVRAEAPKVNAGGLRVFP